MHGPGRCWRAAYLDGAHCPTSAGRDAELPPITCCTHLAWLSKLLYLAYPRRLSGSGTRAHQRQPAARGDQRASATAPPQGCPRPCFLSRCPARLCSASSSADPGQRPALPACRPPCLTPRVTARLKEYRQPYAALSRRCLPASLRCTYDFRLAIGASSSSDITHATPSDTKYACAGAATSSHATDYAEC